MLRGTKIGCMVVALSASLCADVPAVHSTVRIGVLGLFHPQRLIIEPAGNDSLFVYANKDVIEIERGAALECSRSGKLVRCHKGSEKLAAGSFTIGDRDGGPVVVNIKIPNKIQRIYQGTVEIIITSANGRSALQPVVTMERELAVAAAVKAESPPGAPLEALKAQAVVTRSYFSAAQNRHPDFDYCDTTHCQFVRELPAEKDAAMQATRATQGEVLLYQHKVLPALYSADCGGRTRTLQEIGIQSAGYPYFAVEDTYCLRTSKRWQARVDAQDGAKVAAHSERTRLEIGRKQGWSAVPGTNYTTHREGDELLLEGSGKGHGVGLCQQGAAELAREGKDWRTILAHYYPNTTVGVLE